ncbi:MAG: hypothetical protein HQL39_12885 [Alphaproteobacteria bacterium]|nr:hypothetical protein [Alphaproteobacteria bacterium]
MTGNHKPDDGKRSGESGIWTSLLPLWLAGGVALPLIGLIHFVNLAAGVSFFMVIPTLFFLSEARRTFRRSRCFTDIPTSLLRSATQGYVELSGRVTTKDGTYPVSPISKTSSHYWHVEIVRKKRRGDESGDRWVTLNTISSARTFLPFEDGTGSAYLMIHDLHFTPPNDYCIAYPLIRRIRVRDAKALDAMRDKLPPGLLKRIDGDGPFQVVERVLPAADPLFVTGLLRTIASDDSPTLRAPWSNPLQGRELSEWRSEMCRIEGVGKKEKLRGDERINVVSVDSRAQFAAPLVLASHPNAEKFLVRAQGGEGLIAMLWAAGFATISAVAATIAADPGLASEWLRAIQG